METKEYIEFLEGEKYCNPENGTTEQERLYKRIYNNQIDDMIKTLQGEKKEPDDLCDWFLNLPLSVQVVLYNHWTNTTILGLEAEYYQPKTL